MHTVLVYSHINVENWECTDNQDGIVCHLTRKQEFTGFEACQNLLTRL